MLPIAADTRNTGQAAEGTKTANMKPQTYTQYPVTPAILTSKTR